MDIRSEFGEEANTSTTQTLAKPRESTLTRALIKPGLVEALAAAYAALIKRQRTASSAFVRWSSGHTRSHEFAWMDAGHEDLMTCGSEVRIGPESPIYDAINKMMATAQMNPY